MATSLFDHVYIVYYLYQSASRGMYTLFESQTDLQSVEFPSHMSFSLISFPPLLFFHILIKENNVLKVPLDINRNALKPDIM